MEQMLQQILQEIKSLKKDSEFLKDSLQGLHQNQTDLQKNQSRLEQSQSRLEANQIQANAHIFDIHTAVVRLENDQPKDIVALLEKFDDYFCEKDSELATLNHRVFRVESKLERMSMRA